MDHNILSIACYLQYKGLRLLGQEMQAFQNYIQHASTCITAHLRPHGRGARVGQQCFLVTQDVHAMLGTTQHDAHTVAHA
jgi:hypothetical protein